MALETATDLFLVAVWTALVLDNRRMLRREAGARVADSPSSRALRVGVAGALLLGALLLERQTGGRLWFHPVAAILGAVCAAGGLALHMRARRALGSQWSSRVAVAPGHRVTTTGPYAHVRHPIYLAVLLMAAGTVLAHPSAATLCLAVGLGAGTAIKVPAEERALRAACGEEWVRYAARVPALLPRPWPPLSRASR